MFVLAILTTYMETRLKTITNIWRPGLRPLQLSGDQALALVVSLGDV